MTDTFDEIVSISRQTADDAHLKAQIYNLDFWRTLKKSEFIR